MSKTLSEMFQEIVELKLGSIITADDGVIDGIEYICRLVHDGIIRYSLRELYQRLSEEYIKAQTPSTSPFNNELSRGVMIACDYWLNVKEADHETD